MTFDIDLSLSVLIIFVVVLLGGFAGLNLKNWLSGSGWPGGVRGTFYLTRYDAALEYYGVGSRERRARVNELRANLTESVAEVGLTTSLDRLGAPRALAAEVSERPFTPSWLRGVLWSGTAGLLGICALLLSTDAFVAGFESVAARGQSASWSTPLWTLQATAAGAGTSADFTLSLSLVSALLLLLIPFLLGARVWRLWTARKHATSAAR